MKAVGGMSPPTISYEYQKKGVTEIAFRNWLILKGASLAASGLGLQDQVPARKKSGT
jgi:hypothetical protein